MSWRITPKNTHWSQLHQWSSFWVSVQVLWFPQWWMSHSLFIHHSQEPNYLHFNHYRWPLWFIDWDHSLCSQGLCPHSLILSSLLLIFELSFEIEMIHYLDSWLAIMLENRKLWNPFSCCYCFTRWKISYCPPKESVVSLYPAVFQHLIDPK